MNFIHYLPKRRYSNRGGGTKYYIDCSIYNQYPERIQTGVLLRNVKDQNVAIIHAVAMDDTIQKKNKHIVVKIISIFKPSNKEYEIGEILYQHKLPGFIRYICQFSCFDDTATTSVKISESQPSQLFSKSICQASATYENKKNVLVMPYIHNGSIETFTWNEDNIHILTNLIMHTIFSLAMAYDRIGFTHGDLHLGNVLFKPTKQTQISYQIGESNVSLDTLGFKIVIMDFEKAHTSIVRNSTIPFWRNVLFLCKRIESSFDSYKNYFISWENREIMHFLHDAVIYGHELDTVQHLLSLVRHSSEFTFHTIPNYTYDPDR